MALNKTITPKRKILEIQDLTIPDLQEMMENTTRKIIREFLSVSKKSDNDKLITRKVASEILGISLPTVAKYIHEGLIPALQINGRIRLKESDVMNALSEVKHNKYSRSYE